MLDRSGTLQETVAITYTNKSQIGVWPGGDYRNYLRIILPADSGLLDIAIDKDRQNLSDAVTDPLIYEKNGFVPPNGLEVDKTDEEGKMIYGFFVTVPANSSRTITVTYQLAQKSNLAYPAVKYNLRVLKQPGTDNDPYTFTFNYPDVYKIFNRTKGMSGNGNQSVLSTHLLTDQSIEVDLAKK
jgi:hypothetical protein